MPWTVVHVSREESLGGMQFPVHIRKEKHTDPTARFRHDVVKLIFMSGASTRLTYKSGTQTVPAGSTVLLPPKQWFSGQPLGTVMTTTAYIDEGFFNEHIRWLEMDRSLLDAVKLPRGEPVTMTLPEPFRRRSWTILELLRDQQTISVATSQRLSYAVDLLAGLSAHHGRIGEHVALQRALSLIHASMEEPWTITKLADACSISVSQLSRLFQRHLGTSPARFLREQRAHRLAEILSDDTQSVERAARRVGWPDPAHASRSFRQVYGVSPQTYRTYRGQPRLSR